MLTEFLKMHGAGNDFMVLDARVAAPALGQARIRALADRRTGIGWDQLVVLEAPTSQAADVAMRIFNLDGSEAGACGNAARCVADTVAQGGPGSCAVIETLAGLLPAVRLPSGEMQVDMGAPRLGWADIPLSAACDTLHLPLGCDAAATSMGNPHVTVFVAALDAVDPALKGPPLERHGLFPDRVNVGFAQVLAPDRIRLRVWERGAGLTRACGSGACAALVAAHRRGLADRRAALVLDGGTLEIAWREDDGHVLMSGPSVLAFQGVVDLSTYPA